MSDDAQSQSHVGYDTCHQVSLACPVEATTYGYYPILSVNVFFAVLFGLCLLTQIPIGIRTRTWTYSTGLAIGTLLELLGYIGRVLMHYNPWNDGAFELQIASLVLGPSFIAASIYLTLKHLVQHYGPEFSRLKPRLYPWIFVGCDFGSIVIQAIGGGVAASANSSGSAKTAQTGGDLIVAGIAFQIVTMLVAGALMTDFIIRRNKTKKNGVAAITRDKTTANTSASTTVANTPHNSEQEKAEIPSTAQSPTPLTPFRLKIFWVGIIIAYFTVLIRCIYRLPEMIGGWGNPRMRREPEFLTLDGMMIAFAVLSLTFIHPGFCFKQMSHSKPKKRSSPSSSSSSSSQATVHV